MKKNGKVNEVSKTMSTGNYNNLFGRVADILLEARSKVVREINKTQVLAYWEIGHEIVEFEQMRQFYLAYPQKFQTLSGKSETLSAELNREKSKVPIVNKIKKGRVKKFIKR